MISDIYLNILEQISRGLLQTIVVTISCFSSGIFLALLIIIIQKFNFSAISYLLNGLSFIFRAVPIVVLVFLIYFGLPSLGFTVGPLLAMNLSLGAVTGFYLAEVFRGAILSIDGSELLASKAMGFTRIQQMFYIEAPQMLRFAVPGICNEFTTTLKNSPYAYVIGITEMMRQANSLTATTNLSLQIYLCIGILYFAVYRVSLLILNILEKKFSIC